MVTYTTYRLRRLFVVNNNDDIPCFIFIIELNKTCQILNTEKKRFWAIFVEFSLIIALQMNL